MGALELAAVAILLAVTPAQAHVPTTPCVSVAHVLDVSIAECHAARLEHAHHHAAAAKLTRRCLAETRMPSGLCSALVDTILRDRYPRSWATDRSLDELLRRESTFDPNAVNDRSDACGWFQRLVRRPHPRGGRGCPWAFVVVRRSHGRRVERVLVDPTVQTRDGLRYIADRYRTPAAALRHHNRTGWY